MMMIIITLGDIYMQKSVIIIINYYYNPKIYPYIRKAL